MEKVKIEVSQLAPKVQVKVKAGGIKGDKGDEGEQGVQGIQGVQGVQGIQGEIGDKGDSEGKTFESTAQAMAEDPLPANNTPFTIRGSDSSDGYYIYSSGESGGYKFLNGLVGIANTVVETNETVPVSGRAVSDSLKAKTGGVIDLTNITIEDLSQSLLGAVNSTNGTILGGVNNFYVDIDCKGFSTINMQVYLTGSVYGVAFLDDLGAYISGDFFTSATNSNGDRETINVPSNAATFRYCYFVDAHATSQGYPLFDYFTVLGNGLVGESANNIVRNTENIAINTSSINDLNTGADGVKLKNLSQELLGAVNSTNGTILGGANNFYVDVDVTGVLTVNYQIYLSGTVYGIAFFDEFDVYISGVVYTSASGLSVGDRVTEYVPSNAKTLRYCYHTDTYATSQSYPLFDYVILNYNAITNLDKRVTILEDAETSSEFLPRPSSGTLSFSVEVNGNVAELDTDQLKGDDVDLMTDYGVLQLPTNYEQIGEPVRLAVVCHGAGISQSVYTNPVPDADGKVLSDPSRLLVKKGYAVFDMFANPSDWSGGTSELHYGSPLVLECYKKGYDYILKNYNIKRDGLFVSGSSMGGLSSFQIVQSGLFPVLAQAGYCPAIDLFKQAYCNPWTTSTYQRQKIAEYFRFANWETYDGSYDAVYFEANFDKLIGYNPIFKNLVNGDALTTFDAIPASPTVFSDAAEITVFDLFRSTHPVPLKIWHNYNDTTVTFRYSQYFIEMIKRSGQLAFLRPFTTGGHNAWANGDDVITTDIDGNSITVKSSQWEGYLWFERFNS